MKTKIKIQQLFMLSIVVIVMSSSSCKKDEKNKPLPDPNSTTTQGSTPGNAPKGTLMFHLHAFIGDQEVDAYNIEYTNGAGRNISLSLAQFYMSEIQLEKLDGTYYSVSGKTILKIQEAETFVVGDVTAGNYKSVKFMVGLPPSTNDKYPAYTPDSLILNRSEMRFSKVSQPEGYVFLNVQGSIDTSADMSGKMSPFTYKIGTNANYKQVQMPIQNFTIVPSQVQFVHMYIDYNRLFSGITLDNTHLNIKTSSENSSSLASQITSNIASLFSYE